MTRDFLKEVPVPTAGLALGVVAIGKLISPYNSYFEITCTTISIVIIALVTAKAVLCRKALAHDLHQPVQAAVFGTFFMTYMQLSTYLALISLPSARVLWFAAVIGQFILMAWFTRERYLEFIRERLYLMHKLLSDQGTLYVHIDLKVGHYVKILLDEIFGMDHYVNDITRIKSNPKNFSRKAFGNEKDVLYIYSKKLIFEA